MFEIFFPFIDTVGVLTSTGDFQNFGLLDQVKQKKLKIDQNNNNLRAKIVFVARCDIHLEIGTKKTKLEMVYIWLNHSRKQQNLVFMLGSCHSQNRPKFSGVSKTPLRETPS